MQRRPRILVVEDYAPARELIEVALTGSFMRTVCVCDGREALVYLTNARPDLVLTDFIMPNVDGLTLAREIRRRSDLWDLPVVFLTGADSSELRQECSAAGVVAVIAKPFRSVDLVERLKQILRAANGPGRYDLLQCQGWSYAPIGSVILPASAETERDRLVLPIQPDALGVSPIIKRQPRLFEARPVEPDIRITPSPSRWDFLPLGTAIPDFAAVGRTVLSFPRELTPPDPPRPRFQLPLRPRPSRPNRGRWEHRTIGAARLFDAEPLELLRSVDTALGQLEAA